MAVMKVVQAPNEVLNNLAKEVTFKESGLAKLLLDMEETLVKHTNPPGVGLAAPQVGVGLRIFLAKLGSLEMDKKGRHSPVSKHTSSSAEAEGLLSRGELDPYQEGTRGRIEVFINPKILEVSGDTSKETVDLDKLRMQKSGVRIQNLIEKREKIYMRLEARIMQHETDHLQGKLFTA